MSAMHLTTDLIGGDSFGQLSAITGSDRVLRLPYDHALADWPCYDFSLSLVHNISRANWACE